MKTKPLFVAFAIVAATTSLHAQDSAEAARIELASAEREKAEASMTSEEKAEYAKKMEAEVAEATTRDPKEHSGKVSDVQSPARPFDLDIINKVQVAATDKTSKIFQKTALPDFVKISETRLNEAEAAQALDAIRIDPNKLTLAYDTSVRVYFVGEGAGYHNTLGFYTTGKGGDQTDAALIFPDASSNLGLDGSGKEVRDVKNPLLPGDFVNLGTFKAGTKLDFFLIADGVNGGKNFYSTVDSHNPDSLFHAVNLAPEGSPYLLLSFEDLFGGGDEDYNDVVFAVEIGRANIKHLQEFSKLTAPEPSMAIGALLGCGVFLGTSRRRRA